MKNINQLLEDSIYGLIQDQIWESISITYLSKAILFSDIGASLISNPIFLLAVNINVYGSKEG